MPHHLIKDRLKDFRKAENQSYRALVRRIGTVTFFRDRLNLSKLSARRTGRSRETQTEEFDQAVSEFGSIVFEKEGFPPECKPSENKGQRGPEKRHNKEFYF